MGTVDLGTSLGSTLNLSLLNARSFLEPTTFLLINNERVDSIVREFGRVTRLPMGWSYSLDYAFSGIDSLGRMGSGNDFALTLSACPEPSSGLLAGQKRSLQDRVRQVYLSIQLLFKPKFPKVLGSWLCRESFRELSHSQSVDCIQKSYHKELHS
ncbi:MAG TPA: hypothetical protein PKD64_12075 [Pirellulaceae bacterium]|nr:hypothetical protein [Pirellulaceae bacterium]HMO92923.1 hypothetical protein [Pirellulaceae bacterium]HMP71056.1 hypothetical protein [Pirellulaceae bacterium]